MGKHPEHSSENEPRGESLPARLRLSVRRGISLVEMMISMLILAIVCVAWMQIIGVQSASRESFRREAVERLAGMMDAFMQCKASSVDAGNYKMDLDRGSWNLSFVKVSNARRSTSFFDTDEPSISYHLEVVDDASKLPLENRPVGWDDPIKCCCWLIGRVYDSEGDIDSEWKVEGKKPFFTLCACLGLYEE